MRSIESRRLPLLIVVVGLAACSRESAISQGQSSSAAQGGAASSFTERANRELAASLPLDEQQDFEDAKRGFIATDDPLVIAGPNGATAWDFPSYAFIEGDAPATVNPSLWRQAKLNGQHGLFEVAPGIH
jgi:alkyl sulfatase BDS1-like metallo-beta-lactamase superfamily hydrolase